MRPLLKTAAVLSLIGALAAPMSAFAAVPAFLPFGGRIIASVPCLSPEGVATWVTIVPFGLPGTIPFSFIWVLGVPPLGTLSSTIPPAPSIPPTHPGEQILGTYVPLLFETCTVTGIPHVGLRMLTENVSLLGGGF